MYFEQKIINGVLCHRGTPNGEWIKYSQEELTSMLENYHIIKNKINEILDDASNYDFLKNRSQALQEILWNMEY